MDANPAYYRSNKKARQRRQEEMNYSTYITIYITETNKLMWTFTDDE